MSTNETAVQQGFRILAQSLEPHIAGTLAPHLGGVLSWTDVLSELDKLKGKSGHEYYRYDPQVQLRVITEPLGKLGYPFSDRNRIASIYGGELRLVRNRLAHGYTFSAMEALRALDTMYILINHIGDGESATEAAQIRAALIQDLVSESTTDDEGDEDEDEPAPQPAPGGSDEEPQVGQEPESTGPFQELNAAYEPWEVIVAGDIAVLDDLPKKAAKEKVRAAIEEIVDLEGPIHRDRLTKLVGYAYGLGRVHQGRAKKIANQIAGTGCHVDGEKFVWPSDIDVSEWKIYRTNTAAVPRKFAEISPVEIGNAAADILKSKGEMSMDELRPAVLGTFGKRRSTKSISNHFLKGLEHSVSQGKVVHNELTGMVKAAVR